MGILFFGVLLVVVICLVAALILTFKHKRHL